MSNMDTNGFKFKYLDEQYQNLSHLGKEENNIFIAKEKHTGKIAVKKYITSETMSIYNVLNNIDNPHLVKIYDYAYHAGNGLLIEEFINGITLAEYLEGKKSIPENEAIKIITDLCSVLKDIHSVGIIHRDINLDNIMLSNDGVLKLVDFEISRKIKLAQTQDTTILGTLGYAAPEQFGFTQTDARTDIYAVGVLLNKLLTGKFPNENLYSKKPLNKIIKKCIEIDARSRYQNINELLNALHFNISIYSFGLPGLRTSSIWKNILSSIAYFLMMLYTITYLSDFATSPKIFILELIALLLYVWIDTLIAFNIGYWDRKIPPFCNMPKQIKILIRVLMWFIIFYWGILLENHVRFDLLGIPKPSK
jgi:serine/threonine protein kinase